MSDMTPQVEAALAEVIANSGNKQLASAFGLFLAEHKGKLGRAAISAMREPTEIMLNAGPPEPYMDKDVWAKMIDAAL